MQILAFTGLRYAAASAADPGSLAAPPFDQIDDRLRDRLHTSSPHHFAHLTRPLEHEQAAALHRAWLEDGTITREDEPALYPYTIEQPDGSSRLGLCCLVGVSPARDGDLRPHEQTVDKPLADRLALLEAMAVDLEPVLLLAEDEDGGFEGLLGEARGASQELVRHHDAKRGDEHVLSRLTDPDLIGRFQALLRDRWAAIADGHHRTKVAQLFARKSGAEDGSAAAAKLAVLTSLSSAELKIDPIHRAVLAPLELPAMTAMVRERLPQAGRSGSQLAAAVAAAAQPAVGVCTASGEPEIWLLDPDRAPEGTPGGGRLAVVLLHYQLLRAAGLELQSAVDGTISYRSDPDDLWQMVQAGDGVTGFWLPPMDPTDFADATARGELLPPKSTRFLPKLISGLVWSGHDGTTA